MKIRSPIGEYDYRVERLAFRGGQLEVLGRLGEWQTTTILEPSDLIALMRKASIPAGLALALLAVTWGRRRV